MSKVVVVGGTGYAGSHIAREAVNRGHEVTVVARHAPEQPVPGTTVRTGSLFDAGLREELLAAADVLVVATHATTEPPLLSVVPALLAGAAATGTRLGGVGGAGSLRVAEDGPRLVDTPEFPDAYKPEALAHAQVLEAFRADTTGADWFYVSPAPEFGAWAPGETTGSYRSTDEVVLPGTGEISGTDFALAFVDEIDAPKHSRARFGVSH